ncbi:MAG: hypothetical protein LC648_05540 [Novosphingobium sp.]|nr:hypothetical protein [Novosphingobium sp.]
MDLGSAEPISPVAAEAPAVAAGDSSRGETIDLLQKMAVEPRCPRPRADEIVVCAQDQEEFRLRPLPDTYEKPAPDATVAIGDGATVETTVEGANVGGWQSNRVMVRFKIKL